VPIEEEVSKRLNDVTGSDSLDLSDKMWLIYLYSVGFSVYQSMHVHEYLNVLHNSFQMQYLQFSR